MEWVGEIPAHWDARRLRFVLETSISKGEVRNLDPAIEVSFVPMEAIREFGGIDLDSTKPLSEVVEGYTYFRNGDVIVAKITPCFENGKGALASSLSSDIGFGTTELHVLRSSSHLHARFLLYLTFSDHFRRIGTASMYGAGGQKRISDDFIRDFRHPLPDFPEQRTIATFLDRETAKIDGLVARKERLIELLQEKRTALITSAVTRGLDPNVPMKDSGIEWLGEIPAHWEVIRTRFLCDMTTGDKDTQDAMEEGEYPFFVRSDNVERLPTYTFDGEGVLTSGDGAGVGKIFHHYIGKFDFHQRVYLFCHFRRVVGRFFYYFVKANLCKVVLALSAKSTVDSLRRPMLQDFPVAVGPEQAEIVAFLDRETENIDALTAKAHQAIALLKEFRTALISAAVTGKIDVRGQAA